MTIVGRGDSILYRFRVQEDMLSYPIKAYEHDILKLIPDGHHYHPCEEIKLAEIIKTHGYWSLLHHCVPPARNHRCPLIQYPFPSDFLLLKVADWRASTISRTLRIKGKKPKTSWEIYKPWQDNSLVDKWRFEYADIYEKLSKGEDLGLIYKQIGG